MTMFRKRPPRRWYLSPARPFLNGGLSPIFRDRADAAIGLYEAKSFKILVSGDKVTSHNEVNLVRNYLLGKGVPTRYFSTMPGLIPMQHVPGARHFRGYPYSLPHSPSTCRAHLYCPPTGDRGLWSQCGQGHHSFKNYVREVFAQEKAVLT